MSKERLYAVMKRKGITASDMAKKIGISRKTFWAKCNGRTEFKQSEMVKIVEVLNLESPNEIFFAEEVS